MQGRHWVGVAALLGLVAVAAGAFGAHGLEASGDARAARLVETASRYQMWHALAMLAYLGLGYPGRLPLQAWALGAILFPFSLYALALGAPTAVAMVTPVGGLCLLAGWTALAWSALRAGPVPPAGSGAPRPP
jgi:uncharacterized membrane protein YgdD (TMEM256/DUF423 family)